MKKIIIIIFLFVGYAFGDHYVDPVAGDDVTGDGSSESPWKTIRNAEVNAVDGSTVYLRSGNYGDVLINRASTGRTSWADADAYEFDSGDEPVEPNEPDEPNEPVPDSNNVSSRGRGRDRD